MSMIINLLSPVVLICGLIIFFNALHHIKFKFSRRTPLPIRLGAAMVCAGALFYLASPVFCGCIIVIGQAVLIFGERRRDSIFSRNSGGTV